MRKLVVQSLVFALVQLAVATVLLWFYRVDDQSYLAASQDKHTILAARRSPRLIFVGGSNLAFGLNSGTIARALPYEPVNLALHAGLGLRFMLSEAEHSLRANDVVVISPEYQHFTGRRVDVLLQLLEQRPSSIRHVPGVYYPTLLDQALNHFGGMVRGGIRGMLGRQHHGGDAPPYFRRAFNQYGDVTAHWRLPAPKRLSTFGFGEYSSRSIARTVRHLNAFHQRARARGARVYFWYPTIPDTILREHRETIAEIDATVWGLLTFPVLNRPEAATLPRQFFFDTPYHLTEAGAAHRTNLLIDRLRREIQPVRFAADERARR
jgi:hypothetical protein